MSENTDTPEVAQVDRRTVLTAVGTASIGASTIASTAASSSSAPPNGSNTSGGNSSSDGGEDVDVDVGTTTPTQYLAQISPTAKVLDYNIEVLDRDDDDGRARISVTVENDVPQEFVMSDVLGSVGGEGVSSVSQESVTLPSGKQRLSMVVGTFDGEYAALGVATTGGAVTVSTGLPGRDAAQVSLPFGVGVGVAVSGSMFALGAYRERNEKGQTPESVAEDDGGLL